MSQQNCPSLSAFLLYHRKSLGHRPEDSCLSHRVSQGPCRCPEDFLKFMCLFLSLSLREMDVILSLKPGRPLGKSFPGRKICVQIPGPPENFTGEKITATDDFAYFSEEKHMDQGGRTKIEKKTVQVCRLNFPALEPFKCWKPPSLRISPTIYRAQNPEAPKGLKKGSREEFGTSDPGPLTSQNKIWKSTTPPPKSLHK